MAADTPSTMTEPIRPIMSSLHPTTDAPAFSAGFNAESRRQRLTDASESEPGLAGARANNKSFLDRPLSRLDCRSQSAYSLSKVLPKRNNSVFISQYQYR